MIAISKTGDWEGYSRALSSFNQKLPVEADGAIALLAERVRAYIFLGIYGQQFRVRRLRRSTIARKGHAVPFISTGDYVGSIAVLRDPEGYRVGIPDGKRAASGVAYQDIARDLEFGNSKQPPRPHWRPTAKWAQRQMPGVGISVVRSARGG